jgi:photosystem II stability/assembly factor-like uncharacterized protein
MMKKSVFLLFAFVFTLSLIGFVSSISNTDNFTVNGIGGAGGMYVPSISPYDSNIMLVTTDMSGDLRSSDGGKTWSLIKWNQKYSGIGVRPIFLPNQILWTQTPNSWTPALVKRSYDNGATWSDVINPVPWTGAVSDLAAIPGTPNILFVGSSNGLWRSVNDGVTWSQVQTGFVGGILTLGNEVYLTMGTSFYKSIDSGATWGQIAISQANGGNLTSIAGGISGPSTTIFITASGVGTLKSTDKGSTWSVVHANNGQDDIVMSRNQVLVAYSGQQRGYPSPANNVWKTSDGGSNWVSTFPFNDPTKVEKSWVQIEAGWDYYISVLGLGVSDSDPNLVFLGTQADLYLSRNGGTIWNQTVNKALGILSGDTARRYQSIGMETTTTWHYYFDPWNRSRRYIGYSDFGFVRSVDNGTTWSHSVTGCPYKNSFYDVEFDPDIPGRMYAAASTVHDIPHYGFLMPWGGYGLICISNDYGVTWSSSGIWYGPTMDIEIDPNNHDILYAAYVGFLNDTSGKLGGVFKSTDRGATWTRKVNGLGYPDPTYPNVNTIQVTVYPTSGNVYAGITGYQHGSYGFGCPGGIYKSTNGGDSWTSLTSSLNLKWPGHFVIDPNNENIIYLIAGTAPGSGTICAGGTPDQGGVYKTTNGGASWTRVLRDSDFAATGGISSMQGSEISMAPNNPNEIYLGTVTHGLWKTTDAGANWQRIPNFPFLVAHNVDWDPLDPTQYYVSTFGSGIWGGPGGSAQPSGSTDVNSDGKTNVIDLVLVIRWQGKNNGQGDWNNYRHLDVNNDNVTSMLDVNAVMASM